MNDREAFEKWLISDSGVFLGDREMLQRKDNGEYFWIETYMAFEGWQAAYNQALEKVGRIMESMKYADEDGGLSEWESGYNGAVKDLCAIVEKAKRN